MHRRKFHNLRRYISRFWYYQGWLIFFRPPVIFFLLASVIIFYFGLAETQKAKIGRFKWIAATVSGVKPDQIQYIGDGWLEISTQRKTNVNKIYEPIQYRVNPFRWLFFQDLGFVRRWRGRPFDYVTHPIVYNDRGEVWINKEGTWRRGEISGRNIKWDVPQGTRKVTEHEISVQGKKLQIKDK